MIFLLDEDPIKNAQCLDDIALDKQIKAIAQTLSNVHWVLGWNKDRGGWEAKFLCYALNKDTPLLPRNDNLKDCKYTQWASLCRANYEMLVEMGLKCCEEFHYRSLPYPDKPWEKKRPELAIVICWARDNVPQLPDNYKKDTVTVEINGIKQKVLSPTLKQEMTYFSLTIPAKYWVVDDPFPVCDLVASHRKYYQAKLKKGLKRKIKCPACWDEPEHLLFAGIKAKCPGYIEKPITPTFTRREKPEWLNLED